jgi:Arc/MetJ-type ribon-helix-helix transcriptional regulator
MIAVPSVSVWPLPVVSGGASERPRVGIIPIARPRLRLDPVVIAIVVAGATAAPTGWSVDVPLVVAWIEVARIEIHTASSLLAVRRYNVAMNVELTPDQRAFVQKAIEIGRFTREEEAVQEAMALWEERERRRIEILAMLDEADAELARGEGREFKTKEDTQALADEIKQRLRRRIAGGPQ